MSSIFVVNKTGGVGKTTLTELLYAFLYLHKKRPQPIAIDSDDDSEAKLSDRLKGVVEIDADFSNEKDEGVTRFFSELVEKDCLVDFGANVFSKFKKRSEGYGLSSFLREHSKPIVFIPVTSDRRSLKDAISVVDYFSDLSHDLHASQIYIVRNFMAGKFEIIDELNEAIARSRVSISVLDIQKIREPKILEAAYALKKPFEYFALVKAENAMRVFPELDPVRAGRYAFILHQFVDGFFKELDRVHFLNRL